MIESSLQFSSAWNSDPFLSRDLFLGIDYPCSFGGDTERCTEKNECFQELEVSSTSVSPVHSVSGCSTDGDWANFEDMHNILPVTDSSMSVLLQEESLVDSLGLCDLNWTAFSESLTEQTVPHTSILDDTLPTSKKKKCETSQYISSSMQWSEMSHEEQLETIEALTQIISHKMSLCEQMKIIMVIDPSAVIKSSDTEFAIDLGCLNDLKLQTIKDIIKKHAVLTPRTQEVDRVFGSSDTFSSSLQNSSRNSAKGKLQRKHPCEKQPDIKEFKMRQRKVLRQDKKEKRSGLFVHEKKIKKLSNPHEEDVDVNILE